ncbi:hypothetical protein [Streptomyces sp. HF10]|uniref:hypothetical protein n=1 Tax=Streptomyces sp. HF10 TaxID=2692233 RepID=UPI001318DFB8|nr:hypothetical protein [Streptomyces sp. HF10]QHC29918.1 hypothetical protein GR129_14905 [Streptomyces sp. HF10]
MVALLRAAHTGTRLYPANKASSVMGMDLYLVDPARMKEAPFTMDDRAAALLRCLARPSADQVGALTALPAALPSLLGEEWRTTDAVDDPHCRYRVDLTD